MYRKINNLASKFFKEYHKRPDFYLDTGGRLEIVGNHTDHNHGKCLVANCSLRIHCVCCKEDRFIRIKSKGFKSFSIYLDELDYDEKDNKTKRLIKGILYSFKERGYKIGGFYAYLESDIPYGSGVSSSAAVESLFGYLLSYLYNGGKVDPLTIARIGQFSENNYFNKPCGLLDQIGTSFDDCNFIDFKNFSSPTINTIDFELPLSIFLVKSEGDHSNLTPLYAEIPASMKMGAKLMGNKEFLRDVEEANPIEVIKTLKLTEHQKDICEHFYLENEVVDSAVDAIKNNNVEQFLTAVRSSQQSSKNRLKNTMVEGEYKDSPQEIIDTVSSFLGNRGAVRVHGGGFKGTVLVFVKKDFEGELDQFLNDTYGSEKYYKVEISKRAVNIFSLIRNR